MSRANQIAPQKLTGKASATSKDHCHRIGLDNHVPCAGLCVVGRVQTECPAAGRDTVWVWENNPLKSCLGSKATSHFQGWPCWALLCWILPRAPDPNKELPFQSQMSFPCEQMNLTETRSVNKSWTSDNTTIPSLDGRRCVVEGEQIQSTREQEQMAYCSSIWMNLSGIMLSERSQSQKATRCIIHVYVIFAKTELEWWRTDGWFPVAGCRRRWLQMNSAKEVSSFWGPSPC